MFSLQKQFSIHLQILFLLLVDDYHNGSNSKSILCNALHESDYMNHLSSSPPPASATSSSNVAADATWEFNSGLDGWGQATISEMNAEVYHMGGEMRVEIISDGSDSGSSSISAPHLDSPVMKLPIGERETLALRYRFDGPSKFGKIRLRGFETPNVVDHGFVDWGHDYDYDGTDSDDRHGGFLDVYFPIIGDGLWHIGYAEIEKGNEVTKLLNGTITQIRLWPGCYRRQESSSSLFSSSLIDEESSILSVAPQKGNSFHIDWIRLVRAPVINRVTGCFGEKYFPAKSMQDKDAEYNIVAKTSTINNVLNQYQTEWIRRQTNHSYSLTYNCISRGLEEITLEGHNFGLGGANGSGAPAHVYIDGQPCIYVKHDQHRPQQKITCLTPKLRQDYRDNIIHYHRSFIEVRNGKLTGLTDTSIALQYALPPPKPMNIVLTNFASGSIDISWQPGGSIWDVMTYTGYIIKWRKKHRDSSSTAIWSHSLVIGNITTTTIRGLTPNTSYTIGIAGLNEDQSNKSWFYLDLYGRRRMLDDALEGPIATTFGHTLKYDVEFQRFDANSTQSHGPKVQTTASSIGPTGIESGEGHYGLVLVGHANVENCNASSFCCDSFDEVLGICNDETSHVCVGATSSFEASYAGFNNNDNDGNRHGNEEETLPGHGKIVQRYNNIASSGYFSNLFSSPCGPALRLTPSHSRQVGAAWYPRQLEVGEGFETNFTFRISNPSMRCNNMDGVYTHCRARGGDGFAFVIQGEGVDALGTNGKGMGYSGINNSLAVEFDTYFDPEENDPYENHISIQTRGWRHSNSEDHLYSLGHTNNVPDLTDGTIRIRIKYEPFLDTSHLSKPSFVTSPHMSYFLSNGDFRDESVKGTGDWGYSGLGLLHIYCENLQHHDPILTVPLHLSKTLKLNRGRAWVGFTASTGDETFQVHDILDFTFSSLRLD